MSKKKKYKKYNSVESMVEGIFGKKAKETKEIKQNFKDREISNILFRIRNSAGLSPKQLSEKMNMRVKDVEAIEESTNSEINIEDLKKYTVACDFDLGIFFVPKEKPPIKYRINSHVQILLELFKELGSMCEDDVAMLLGAAKWKLKLLKPAIESIVTNINLAEQLLKSETVDDITQEHRQIDVILTEENSKHKSMQKL